MEVKGVYIVDRLEHLAEYAGISAAFAKAVEFLKRSDLNSLAAGRHEIDGENCFVIVNDEAELVAPAERTASISISRFRFRARRPTALRNSIPPPPVLSTSPKTSAFTSRRSCR